MSISKGIISGDQGQTLLESALSIGLLLSMVFGVIMGGYLLYTYHYLSYAARLGSRYAIVRGSACNNSNGMPDCPNVTSAQIQTYVISNRFPGLDPTQMAVASTWPKGTDNPGDTVNVTVQYPFPFYVPFVNQGTVTMQSTSQMVISQ